LPAKVIVAPLRAVVPLGRGPPELARLDEGSRLRGLWPERGQSLESEQTRKLRAAALSARLLFEPAMREGSATGRAKAKAGLLTADAAAAARGRSFPPQRRKKAAQRGRETRPRR
jgi:hypothetical protein